MTESASYLGIDISDTSIEKCRLMFGSDARQFKVADIRDPIDLVERFDVVICFEMIEHIHEHELLMDQVRKLLQPDGVFISSTPEIGVYNSLSFERNEHHVK